MPSVIDLRNDRGDVDDSCRRKSPIQFSDVMSSSGLSTARDSRSVYVVCWTVLNDQTSAGQLAWRVCFKPMSDYRFLSADIIVR